MSEIWLLSIGSVWCIKVRLYELSCNGTINIMLVLNCFLFHIIKSSLIVIDTLLRGKPPGHLEVDDILAIHRRVMGFVEPDQAGTLRRTQVDFTWLLLVKT